MYTELLEFQEPCGKCLAQRLYRAWYVCRIPKARFLDTSRGRVVIVVVVVVVTLTRRMKPVVTRQAPVTLELRKYPRKRTRTSQRWYTHIVYITADAIFIPSNQKHVKK